MMTVTFLFHCIFRAQRRAVEGAHASSAPDGIEHFHFSSPSIQSFKSASETSPPKPPSKTAANSSPGRSSPSPATEQSWIKTASPKSRTYPVVAHDSQGTSCASHMRQPAPAVVDEREVSRSMTTSAIARSAIQPPTTYPPPAAAPSRGVCIPPARIRIPPGFVPDRSTIHLSNAQARSTFRIDLWLLFR